MVELKQLSCQNCGGQVDRATMKYPYCDTQYERTYNDVPVRFVVQRPGVHVIRAQVKIADEMALRSPEEAQEYAMNKLRRGIADGLMEYMKLLTTREFDPMNMCQIIRGEVRVVDPIFTDY